MQISTILLPNLSGSLIFLQDTWPSLTVLSPSLFTQFLDPSFKNISRSISVLSHQDEIGGEQLQLDQVWNIGIYWQKQSDILSVEPAVVETISLSKIPHTSTMLYQNTFVILYKDVHEQNARLAEILSNNAHT